MNKSASAAAISVVAILVAFPVHSQAEEAEPVQGEVVSEVDLDDVAIKRLAAAPPAPRPKVWEFTVAPYLLLPFMTGSLTQANQTVDVNLNTGSIIKALNWALMLYFEAKHPKWAITTDLLYMNLGHGGELPVSGRSADLTVQQLLAEVDFLGRIATWFELGFGGRVNFVQSGLTAPAGMVLPPIDLDQRHTWFDPLVVLRFSVPFKNDSWRLSLRADTGGFGLGSTYAWQAYTLAGYNFEGIKGHRVFELALGFRALGMKYETGSGLNRFVYDLITYGPEIGFLFHFGGPDRLGVR